MTVTPVEGEDGVYYFSVGTTSGSGYNDAIFAHPPPNLEINWWFDFTISFANFFNLYMNTIKFMFFCVCLVIALFFLIFEIYFY